MSTDVGSGDGVLLRVDTILSHYGCVSLFFALSFVSLSLSLSLVRLPVEGKGTRRVQDTNGYLTGKRSRTQPKDRHADFLRTDYTGLRSTPLRYFLGDPTDLSVLTLGVRTVPFSGCRKGRLVESVDPEVPSDSGPTPVCPDCVP